MQCGSVDGFQHFGDIRCIFYAEVETASVSETLISSTKITASFPRKKDRLYSGQCILKKGYLSQRFRALQTEKIS